MNPKNPLGYDTFHSVLVNFIYDGTFSIEIGLEHAEVARSICWAGSTNNLQHAMNGWSGEGEGAPAGYPMPKSILSYGKERIQLLMALGLRTFCWWGCSIFIVDDHGDFPYWMVIRSPPHWVGDLFFLIAD